MGFMDLALFSPATDKTLLEKLTKQLEGNEAFEMNKGGYAFTIKHFAGPITYQGTGLLEKNKDPLPNRVCRGRAGISSTIGPEKERNP